MTNVRLAGGRSPCSGREALEADPHHLISIVLDERRWAAVEVDGEAVVLR